MPFKRRFKDKYAGRSPENASVVRTLFDLFFAFFLCYLIEIRSTLLRKQRFDEMGKGDDLGDIHLSHRLIAFAAGIFQPFVDVLLKQKVDVVSVGNERSVVWVFRLEIKK